MAPSCEAHPNQRATEVMERKVLNYPKGAKTPVVEMRTVHCCKRCTGKANAAAADAETRQLTAYVLALESRLAAVEAKKK